MFDEHLFCSMKRIQKGYNFIVDVFHSFILWSVLSFCSLHFSGSSFVIDAFSSSHTIFKWLSICWTSFCFVIAVFFFFLLLIYYDETRDESILCSFVSFCHLVHTIFNFPFSFHLQNLKHPSSLLQTVPEIPTTLTRMENSANQLCDRTLANNTTRFWL